MTRESLLIATLVELADNLVDEFDVIEVLTMLCNRCVETIDIDAAGSCWHHRGRAAVRGVIQRDNARTRALPDSNRRGPCIDCFNSGESIIDRTSTTP